MSNYINDQQSKIGVFSIKGLRLTPVFFTLMILQENVCINI